MEDWKEFIEWCITHGAELKFGEDKIILSIGSVSMAGKYDNIEIFDFKKFMNNFVDVTMAAYDNREYFDKLYGHRAKIG